MFGPNSFVGMSQCYIKSHELLGLNKFEIHLALDLHGFL